MDNDAPDQSARSLTEVVERLAADAALLAVQVRRELGPHATPRSRLQLALDQAQELVCDCARMRVQSEQVLSDARAARERQRGALEWSLRSSRTRRT